ncbi:hypothetical protein [Corallococcus silvisoli]|uniref:hypothetical protein n=1 Tax=Corallococcus silvisoli TaxID=2697031 RepID=UPI001378239D|nr:hypothetical protein [Corallococcus silvisoli]
MSLVVRKLHGDVSKSIIRDEILPRCLWPQAKLSVHWLLERHDFPSPSRARRELMQRQAA